jgi:HEAT repeat protein
MNREFKEKLDRIVQNIGTDGRVQVEDLVTSVVNAGGTSERALCEMALNQELSISLRLNVCWLLPRLNIEKAGDVLEALMSDQSEQIRAEAATALGLVSQREDVVEVLLNALQRDTSKPVRLAALHALGVLSSPQSAAHIINIIQNPEADVEMRADAAEALAHIKDDRVVDVLIDALRSDSPSVRYSAAYALGQQGDERAVPALREVATNDKANTQYGTVASCALESIETITSQKQYGD